MVLKVTRIAFEFTGRSTSSDSVTDAATTASERVKNRLEQLDAFEVGRRVLFLATADIRVISGRTADTKFYTTGIHQSYQRDEQRDEPSMEK